MGNKKYICLVLIILIASISISAVSAADDASSDILGTDIGNEIDLEKNTPMGDVLTDNDKGLILDENTENINALNTSNEKLVENTANTNVLNTRNEKLVENTADGDFLNQENEKSILKNSEDTEIHASKEKLKSGDYTYYTFSNLNERIQTATYGTLFLKGHEYYVFSEGDEAFKNGINVTESLIIYGRGCTIDASFSARIFNVTAADLQISEINFINAYINGDGGAIYGPCTINECNFTNCYATNGGAIYGGSANDCIFINNHVLNGGKGGAIYGGSANNCIFGVNDNTTYNTNCVNCEVVHPYVRASDILSYYGGDVEISFEVTDGNRIYNNVNAFVQISKIRSSSVINYSYVLSGNTWSVSLPIGVYVAKFQLSSDEITNATIEVAPSPLFISPETYTIKALTFNDLVLTLKDYYGNPVKSLNLDVTFEGGGKTTAYTDDEGKINITTPRYFEGRTYALVSFDGNRYYDMLYANVTLNVVSNSFGDLATLINSTFDDTIYLNKNYTCLNNETEYFDGILIDRKLTIYGNGITLNGSNLARIFNVANSSVEFHDINFINGNTDENGGAICGECSAFNCNFTDNQAYMGGAIYGVNAYNCTFLNNSARFDGAMYSGTAYNSSFISNYASGGGAAEQITAYNCNFTNNSAGSGGAVVRSTLHNCSFTNNHADSYGGAAEQCIAYNCNFTENTANYGGAMHYYYQYSYDSYSYNCTFINNTATYGGATANSQSEYSTFISNHATYGGATYFTGSSNCEFINNTANDGGAIERSNANNCIFINNTATNGGASSKSSLNNCNLTCNNGTFGGAMYLGSANNCNFINNTGENGGASAGGTADSCTFINNSASKGGAIFETTANGCILTQNNAPDGGASYGASLNNCSLINNTATNGGASYGGSASDSNFTLNHADNGGATYNTSSNSSIFINNTATNGGASYGGSASDSNFTLNHADNGGAIFNGSASNCIFTNNNATNGGGVSNSSSDNCIFNENTATNGGASYGGNSYNSTFNQNSADKGGAIYNANATECTFISNTASDGGASYDSIANNSSFLKNYATNGGAMASGIAYYSYFNQNNAINGGAIYNGTAINCSIIQNNASSGGGMNLGYAENSTFILNRASNGYDILETDWIDCIFFIPQINVSNFTSMVGEGLDLEFDLIFNSTSYDGINTRIDLYKGNELLKSYDIFSGKTLFLNLTAGEYVAKLSIDDDRVETAQSTISIVPSPTFIQSENHTFKVGTENNLAASIRDMFDNPISNLTLSISLNNGDAVNYTTDENGQIVMSTKDLPNNQYEVMISFGGDENYLESNATVFLTMFKYSFIDLQELINNCTENGTIYLDGDCIYSDMDNGLISTIEINRNLTIYGNGYTINGAQNQGIFKVTSPDVVLHDITFIGGTRFEGGAIYGECLALNCTFINNTARYGGATYNVNAVNCTFIGNDGQYGGAMHNGTAENCTFLNNIAFVGGAIYKGQAYGSIFIENTAGHNGSTQGSGGAINRGYASNCTFIQNFAIQDGGALMETAADNCIFIQNTAAFEGGAIELGTATNCIFTQNYAPFGGAIRDSDAINCTFAQNSANSYGGAMFNGNAYNCSFIYNSANLYPEGYNVGMYDCKNKLKPNITVSDFVSEIGAHKKLMFNVTDGSEIYNFVNVTITIYQNDEEIDTYTVLSGDGWVVDLPGGNYVAELSVTGGDKKFNASIIMVPTPSFIIAEDMAIDYGHEDTLTVTLKDNITGSPINNPIVNASITVEFNGETNSYISDENGQISIPIKGLAAKTYNVAITFDSNNNYTTSTKNVTVTVNKLKTELSADDLIINYTDEGNLLVSLKDIEQNPLKGFNINVDLNGDTYSNITDENGQIKIAIGNLVPNVYTAEISFPGNENYTESNAAVNITVNKLNTEIIAEDLITTEGEEDYLVIFLKNIKDKAINNANITVELNGKSKNLITVNGQGKLLIDLEPNVYIAKINFPGNSYYNPSSCNATITVNPAETNGTNETNPTNGTNGTGNNATNQTENGTDPSGNETNPSGNETNPSDNGTNPNGNNTNPSGDVTNNTDPNGNGTNPSGNNTNPSDNGTSPSDNGTTPPENDTANRIGTKIIYSNMNTGPVPKSAGRIGNYFVVKLVDENNNPLAGVLIQIGFNGVIYNRTTDSQGGARLQINLANEDLYTFAICFLGDDEYNASFEVAKITVDKKYPKPNKANSTTTAEKVNKTQKNTRLKTSIIYSDMVTESVLKVDGRAGKYFVVKLVDNNNKALANVPIKIGFNGVIYNRTTNASGQARLQINLLKVTLYTFAISYLGDEKYQASFEVAKITVKQHTPKLTAPAKTFKASAKTKTVSATFKSSNGNALKGKKIKFTINGKTYTATTNAKGVASVKIALTKKRTYTATAKFAGEATIKATSTKFKVKIN